MSETIDVPAVGKVKKEYVYIGAAGVALVVGVAWWRRRAGGGGDEAPSYYADTRTGSELPTDRYTSPGSIETPSNPDTAKKAPTTDQEWSARVIETLTWYEPSYVSQVVGKYLAGKALHPTEQTVIREAWAQVGQPPGGQRIIVGSPPPSAPPPVQQVAPKGFKVKTATRTTVSLDWDVAPGVIGYQVYVDGKQWGRTVVGSDYKITGLKANTQYNFGAANVYPGWKVGPRATITHRTGK